MLAILGGSGLTHLTNIEDARREIVRTPYGEPSGPLTLGQISCRPTIFLARHGYGHTIPPHEVNYRANIWALREKGATAIIAVASVGGIRGDLKPGDIVIPDQVVDYTWGRRSTFHEGENCTVTHVDFTDPYDETLRQKILSAAQSAGVSVKIGATYATTQGPRLETAAEIRRLERDGCDVVGMTGMPEAALARELDIPYAAINVIANYAAGKGDSAHGIAFDAINAVLEETMGKVRLILEQLAAC
jgi:5'-methylthioadenosine phosphorylase